MELAEINMIHLRMYQLLQKKFDGAKEFNTRIRVSNLSPDLLSAYGKYRASLDDVLLEEAKALVAASEN